jgi:protein SCO1/2
MKKYPAGMCQVGLADKHVFLIIFLVAIAAGLGLWLGAQTTTPVSPGAITAPAGNANFDPRAYKSLLVYPAPKTIAPFSLKNSDGSEFSLAQLQGHWTLLSFGFTTCPDICPTTLTELNAVFGILKLPSLEASAAQIVFISIDPERDTPSSLNSYVKYYNPAFIGATGDIPALTDFATNLGAVFEKEATGPGAQDYTMAHTASIFLINPQGQLAALARPVEQSLFDWPQLRNDVPAFLTSKIQGGQR